MADRRYKEDGTPIPLGGSLNRAPDGRLCTIQTTRPVYPAPETMQQLWRNTSRKRYPREWDGIKPEGALVIWWSEPFAVLCGRGYRDLGSYRAYQASREYGIVEETSREYWSKERFPDGLPTGDPNARRERTKPRYWTTFTDILYANKTFCHWWCRQCGRTYERNMARLARLQMTAFEDRYVIEEAQVLGRAAPEKGKMRPS